MQVISRYPCSNRHEGQSEMLYKLMQLNTSDKKNLKKLVICCAR